ncbi:FtsX-like permease family protein [Sphingomicrobium sp. XHP0239]|uniref:FtsX-like permease family protein n=1 Tax=Sphingomicrobium maritimum TaxID=3133972 RepID=UPI0031CC667B
MTPRTLLPRRPQGATAYLLAVLLFVMTITAAAGLAVWNGNRLVAGAVEARSTVQLSGGIERTDELAEFLSNRDDVTEVRAIAPDEVRRTLETWMGPAAREADLPLPALVDVEMVRGADPALLRADLRNAFPRARLVAQQRTLAPVLGALSAVAALGLALVLAIALAASVAIALATRGALAANRSTIATLHDMGATDRQVAQTFLTGIRRDALVGGSLGTLVALLVLWLLGASGGSSLAFLVGGTRLLGPLDLLALLLLPLLATLMAFLVARFTILRDLRRAL